MCGGRGNGKAAAHHPVRGGDGGFGADAPGIAPSADGALDDWGFRWLRPAGFRAVRGAGISPAARGGYFARCDGRVFRPLRRATGGAAPWTPRFGQRAAGWQEVSARNFVSEQGPASPPYWMYGKKLGRSYGAKGPATPADTPVVSCPIEKNRVKLLTFLWQRRLLIFGLEGEGQDHLEQVAVHRQLHSAVLQLRQTPGNGQS